MTYDKAQWHSEGNYPKALPPENAGTHIGMFLAWAILNDLISDELRDDAAKDLAALRKRKMTGRTFLFRNLDGALTKDDLNAQGHGFAKFYYKKYTGDYTRALGDNVDCVYEIADTWQNFDTIAKMIDERYAAWRARSR